MKEKMSIHTYTLTLCVRVCTLDTMADVEITEEAKSVLSLVSQGNNVLLHGPGGTGKCLAPDTLVRMADGRQVKAKAIRQGMKLMGDDLYPRTVLTTCTGQEAMYEVRCSEPYVMGLHFVCNRSHNLTVVTTSSVFEVTVETYMYLSSRAKRSLSLMFVDHHSGATSLFPFTVVKVADRGVYCGFTLGAPNKKSTPGRFLLGCGLVTHNTYSIRQVADMLQHDGYNVARCATTGIASISLHTTMDVGRTLHSWAGIGLAKEDADALADQVLCSKKSRTNWLETDILIIEEVSMMGLELFEKLDTIGKIVRERFEQPFGGLRIIALGDFLQLPPVNAEWVFLSDAWRSLCFKPVIARESKRYDDSNYYELLMRVRKGKITKEDTKLLIRRIRAYDKMNKLVKEARKNGKLFIEPTVMYSTNAKVDSYNVKRLAQIDSESMYFTANDKYTPRRGHRMSEEMLTMNYKKSLDDMIQEKIELKRGAQVMLRYNVDVERGLCNGSRGVVAKMKENSVLVAFLSGKRCWIDPITWVYSCKKVTAIRVQVPLSLAWSTTIHKSQGMTLDYAVCDIGTKIFCEGQAYVALSRVRSLDSLFLQNYSTKSIFADEVALNYVKELEDIAKAGKKKRRKKRSTKKK